MSLLLFTDTHVDENPDNEYRWEVFPRVRALAESRRVRGIYCLGDAWDRKERFSAAFVNRLLYELRETGKLCRLVVLRGNHDTPLNGPAFFEFVNGMMEGVHYVTEPTPDGDVILLPHTPTPVETWRGIKFSDFRAAFMHVTVTGAMSESGIELTGPRLPILPRSLRLYSGDVHTPQTVRNLTYVGCPHPIKFGDRFPCRMLILDDDYEIAEEIPITTVRKHVLEVNTVEELREALANCRPGDQARVRFHLAPGDIDRWGEIEGEIPRLLREAGVVAASTEVTVMGQGTRNELDLDVAPETILREFSADEGISKELLGIGLGIVEKVK